jgi:hypothetical protein
MNSASERGTRGPRRPDPRPDPQPGPKPDAQPDPKPDAQPDARNAESAAPPGLFKAMSPGVVDYLFRQLVVGDPAEDVQWHKEGLALSAQPPGAELARRLSECDLEALTPTELFHYVRAAQRLASWAESLRENALRRYCGAQRPEPRNAVGAGRPVRRAPLP